MKCLCSFNSCVVICDYCSCTTNVVCGEVTENETKIEKKVDSSDGYGRKSSKSSSSSCESNYSSKITYISLRDPLKNYEQEKEIENCGDLENAYKDNKSVNNSADDTILPFELCNAASRAITTAESTCNESLSEEKNIRHTFDSEDEEDKELELFYSNFKSELNEEESNPTIVLNLCEEPSELDNLDCPDLEVTKSATVKMPANTSLCRTCLKSSFRMKPVTKVDRKLNMTIKTCLSIITGIDCSETDVICHKCLKQLVKCNQFIEQCEQNDAKFNESNMSSGYGTHETSLDRNDSHVENGFKDSDGENSPNDENESVQEMIEEEVVPEESIVSDLECSKDSGQIKTVTFDEPLEEVYESDFEEYSSYGEEEHVTHLDVVPEKRKTMKARPTHRIKRPNSENLFNFCRVCRRYFPDRYSLKRHLNGTSIYVPGHKNCNTY